MRAYGESAPYYSRGVVIVALRKSNEALQSSFSGLVLLQKQKKEVVISSEHDWAEMPYKAKKLKLRRADTNPEKGVKRPSKHHMMNKNELRGTGRTDRQLMTKKIDFARKSGIFFIADLGVKMCGAKIFFKTHKKELIFLMWHHLNMQGLWTKFEQLNVKYEYFTNLFELPLWSQFQREVCRWVLRGSGNDLAEHRLKKPNESCLSGLGKAEAPREVVISPQNKESSYDAPKWRRGGVW